MPVEASTLVWTPTGAVPIFSLKIGDEVLAWNTRISRISTRKVTEVRKQTADHLRVFGDLRTTDSHRFLKAVPDWPQIPLSTPTAIGELAETDRVRSVGGVESVGRTERFPGEVEVWDLDVDELHTYLVGERRLIIPTK